MSFEIEGKMHKIFDTESKSDKFQAREFILETMSGTYSQLLKFQLTQDRCELADRFKENEQVKVFFDLRGREWQGKYFTNLNAWKLESGGSGSGQTASEETPFPNEVPNNTVAEDSSDDPFGDLPF